MIYRLVLSKGKYRVFKTPVNYISGVKPYLGRVKKIKTPTTNMKGTKPYLGRLRNRVHYGLVYGRQLRIWMLDESCEQIEWLLKYEVDIGLYANLGGPLFGNNGRNLYGSWMVEEDNSDQDDSSDIPPDKGIEWDSDNDDIFTLEVDGKDGFGGKLDILGFHPTKKVVFLVNSFEVVS